MPKPIHSSACRFRILPPAQALPLLLTVLAASPPALADAERAAPTDAIELGRTALDHYERGMWSEAFALFESAERQAHSPVFGLYMARCKRQLGELLAARAMYRATAAEKLPADAPAPWLHAVVTANAELRSVEPQIASVCLRAEPPSDVVRVTLTGRDFAVSERCREVELDPGEHRLVMQSRSGRRHSKTFHVDQGQRRLQLPLEISEDHPRQQPQRAAVTPGPVGDEVRTTPIAWHKPLGYTALGVGAVGLGLGTIAGIVAAQKKADLDCVDDRCPQSETSKVRSATRWASVSTVGFIFGAASAAAGVTVLVLVSRGQTDAGAQVSLVGGF